MNTVAAQAQSLYASPFTELFTLDATALRDLDGNAGDIHRFCNTGEIIIGDHTYLPMPIAIEGIGFTQGAAPPQPTLRLSNITAAVRALVLTFDYLKGADLEVSFVLGNPSQGVIANDQVFALSRWRLDQAESTKEEISWTLRSPLDKEGYKLPRRFISRDYCPYTVRQWTGTEWNYEGVQCPYTGREDGPYIDENGNATSDPAKEYFSRTLKGCCEARFGTRNLPFGGFPGAERP